MAEAFEKDTNKNKINLVTGAFRDEDGKPFVLPVVREVVNKLHGKCLNNEYAPTPGPAEFRKLAAELALGEESVVIQEERNATMQGVGGTGSMRLGMEFIRHFHRGPKMVFVPNPTADNHKNIAEQAGMCVKPYKYYDPKTKGIDFKGLLDDICVR